MDIAADLLPEPPRKFRHHTWVMAVLTGFTLALSFVIFVFVPNEGRGPVLGLDGLRDALLILVWMLFGTFTITSTALLTIIPASWQSAIRLLLAYAGGVIATMAVIWLLART